MTADEIVRMWNEDAHVNTTNLGKASTDIPLLHSKYTEILMTAKREVAKAKYLYKRMRGLKNEFFINPTQEDASKYDWEMPDRTILKSEVKDLLDCDDELCKIDLKVQEAELKVDILNDIIRMIHSRNWLIKNAIDDRNFLNGE